MKTKRDEKIGYKVCVQSGNDFYSYMFLRRTDVRVKYSINEWAEPKKGDGPLAVFYTFEDAERFALIEDVIFECKYILSSKEKVLWYWVNGEKFSKLHFPIGTVLADRVMLIKEIKR
jgi:hypothetical protein